MSTAPVRLADLPAVDGPAADNPAALLLDARALAKVLSCSVRHIRRMDTAGELPAPVRIGRLVRWRRAEGRYAALYHSQFAGRTAQSVSLVS